MQTNFTEQQLKDPQIKRANEILRSCVHCGFCTATCPTYQVLGDELDSPRGRIYLMKDMLENNRAPDATTVKHIDRCLSCLSCMTTCPSGVHYMHLVDHAREYINENYQRPLADRALRSLLAWILPSETRFRLAMMGARFAKPFSWALPGKLRNIVAFAPAKLDPPSANDRPQTFAPIGTKKFRVALMVGCAQKALDTDINDATIRVLRRLGCEVVIAKGAGCCGALTHHMGKTSQSHKAALANIKAWNQEIDTDGLDAILINTSGCGTTVKDYGHMFRTGPHADQARTVSDLTQDITEFLAPLALSPTRKTDLKVGYHAACSLQHGQKIKDPPKAILKQLGFQVQEPQDGHLCCGSAGTYNLLQPEISGALKRRKTDSFRAISPQVIAAGNIGCMMQIGSDINVPVVHIIELIDWATGGPKPRKLR